LPVLFQRPRPVGSGPPFNPLDAKAPYTLEIDFRSGDFLHFVDVFTGNAYFLRDLFSLTWWTRACKISLLAVIAGLGPGSNSRFSSQLPSSTSPRI